MAGSGAQLTIGEMSRRTRCKVETIRYYERTRLMPPRRVQAADTASTTRRISSASISFAVAANC